MRRLAVATNVTRDALGSGVASRKRWLDMMEDREIRMSMLFRHAVEGISGRQADNSATSLEIKPKSNRIM